jgi:hypothetical protein
MLPRRERQPFLTNALADQYIGREELVDGLWNIVYCETLLGRTTKQPEPSPASKDAQWMQTIYLDFCKPSARPPNSSSQSLAGSSPDCIGSRCSGGNTFESSSSVNPVITVASGTGSSRTATAGRVSQVGRKRSCNVHGATSGFERTEAIAEMAAPSTPATDADACDPCLGTSMTRGSIASSVG